MSVALSSSMSVNVAFQVEPDDLSTATSTFKTSCPDGFVVPDEPEDDRIRWIDGTGCAVPCRTPLNTEAERSVLLNLAKSLLTIGMVSCIIMCIIWTFDKHRSKQYFIAILAYSSVGYSIFCLTTYYSPDENLCSNNAVAMDSTDGVNLCAVSSVVYLYCSYLLVTTVLMQSIDLFLKVGHNIKTDNFKPAYLTVIFGGSLGPVLFLLGKGIWGYTGSTTCVISSRYSSENYDLYIFFTPLLVILVFSLMLMASVIIEIISVSSRAAKKTYPEPQVVPVNKASTKTANSRNPSTQSSKSGNSNKEPLESSVCYDFMTSFLPKVTKEQLRPLRVPVLFVIVLTISWTIVFGYRMLIFQRTDAISHSFAEWAGCAFLNFDGTNDWKKVCGEHLAYRMSFGYTVMFTIIAASEPLLVAITYMSNGNVLDLAMKYVIHKPLYYISAGKYAPSDAPTRPGSIVNINIHKRGSNASIVTVKKVAVSGASAQA